MKKSKAGDGSRFKEILGILIKHDLIKGLEPIKLRAIIEDLGPTFIKFGQILSLRSDMIPSEFCDELKKLQTEVKPMKYDQVTSVIEASLGRKMSDLFSYFEGKPLGSASIAQVHKAKLHSGEWVVVKVQRQGVRHTMERDIKLLKRAAGVLKIAPGVNDVIDFNTILEELWFTTQEELDFMLEASRLEIFYETNKEVKYVSCPKVYKKLTSNKILVMEYIDGIFIDQLEDLLENGYDLNELGRKLAANYSKQVMEDGLFHADPHPGNILIRAGEIIWLDFGMMGTLSGHGRSLLLKFTDAVVQNDANSIKEVVLSLGSAEKAIDHSRLYGDIDSILGRYGGMDFGGLDIAKYLNEVLEVAIKHHIKVPSSYTMLGRGLTNLEGVIEIVSPEMNYLEVAGDHIANGSNKDVDLIRTMQSMLMRLGTSVDKVLDTPKLLNNIMTMVMKGQAKVGMELQSSHDFEVIMTKLINNLVMGLIISALLIGSSLIATTEMKPQVLDVPLLGAAGYLAAAVLSLGIILDLRKVKKS